MKVMYEWMNKWMNYVMNKWMNYVMQTGSHIVGILIFFILRTSKKASSAFDSPCLLIAFFSYYLPNIERTLNIELANF